MLNKQQPFGGDVISRISATMMDPDGAGAAARRGLRDAGRAGRPGLPRGRRRPGPRLRGRDRRQRDDDRAGAGHRPRAARRGAVHHVDGHAADGAGRRPRPGAAPAGPGHAVPGAGRLRRRRHRRGHARLRDGPRQADPALHRRRHQLRDRAQRRRPDPLHRGAGRAGVRGRRDPVRHARRRRRDRGRQARSREARTPASSSASSATSSRRGSAAPASSTPWPSWSGSGCSTRAAGSSPTRSPRSSRPGWPTG